MPSGDVQMRRLTSANIHDTNENSENVRIRDEVVPAFSPDTRLALPPYSLTVISWHAPSNGETGQASESVRFKIKPVHSNVQVEIINGRQ